MESFCYLHLKDSPKEVCEVMYRLWLKLNFIETAIFAVVCDIFHNIKYQAAVTAFSGFYFEKRLHAELLWQRRQRVLLSDESERFLQVNWHDVGMHAAL